MQKNNNINSTLVKALYAIITFYIVLSILGALLCILTSNLWEYPENAIIAGGIIFFCSITINLITAIFAKRFSKFIFWTHIIIEIICIFTALIVFNSPFVQTLPKVTLVFEEHRNSFDLVNSYVLENFGHLENEYIVVNQNDTGEIYSLDIDGQNIELTDELKSAFNDMEDAVCYSFSGIDIEKYRITYCYTDTYKRYVYSRNGETPNYYYFEGDEMPIKIYKLTNNWYLLDIWLSTY